MRMTRRMFKLGVLSLGALSLGVAAAGGARHVADAPSAARLEADLADCLTSNPTNAAFTVPAFERQALSRDMVRLEAQVRLDWAPGMRLRVLHATGTTAEDAYGALRKAAVDLFVGVVPGFERPAIAA
jgi:hypothetical protein